MNSAGDSVLAEFASVVEAVSCAVAIQTALKIENAELPLGRRMEFRIGVNLGDVMVEGEQIYGDGVNVAARLESLAAPGGILISGSVHEQIRNKLELGYFDLGNQRVKNIAEPVRVFRVLADAAVLPATKPPPIINLRVAGISLGMLVIIGAIVVVVQHVSLRPPSIFTPIPHGELPLPDKPSIAVLPFTNLSGDPGQDYFSDGVTDNIINHLSRVPSLFVIARNSSFTYKNKPAKVQEVGRQLGVRYVLEGSVDKKGNQVRIEAQLADARDGTEVWAQSYDRPLRDVFATQDEIVERILTTLRLQLTVLRNGLPVASIPHGTDNPEAYDYFVRASPLFFSGTREGLAKARELQQRAIQLDPKFSYAYSGIAASYVVDAMSGYSGDPARDLQRAKELAQKTLALDDTNPWGYYTLSAVNYAKGNLTEAADDARQGIALDPSGPFGYQRLADALICSGKAAEGVEAAQRAMRLDPKAAEFYLLQVGWGYNAMQKYEAAITALNQHLVHFPNDGWAHANLAIAYSETGQKELARAEALEIRRINPNVSLKTLNLHPYLWGDQALFARYQSDLREAGLS